MRASTLRWPLFALLGLLVAVGVALLANKLVSESIGISSEPITAGESLTPKPAHRERHRPRPNLTTTPAQTTSTSAAPSYTGTVSGGASSSEGGSDTSTQPEREPGDD
jgi:hypothetical protein